MAQDGSTFTGEVAALMRAPIAQTAGKAVSAPPWLADLKAAAEAMREHRERPAGKPLGRWLGDFLDQDTASGLLPAEEKLLFAAVSGEACMLQSRAALLWAAFEAWRNEMPEAPPEELSFVAAMTKFTAAAPEAVQEVIIEATRHAIAKLKLPPFWEPKDAGEVEKFASAQRAYLARVEAEANPAITVQHARTDERFYQLTAEATIESLTPKPYEPLKLTQEWLNPLLRRDPLNLSAETRARIDTQPRVLRGFFDELIREVKRATAWDKTFAGRLKANEGVLKEHFDAVFDRYAREEWRWVDPEDREVRVRARFLRFLALGGDESAPVHESRLDLRGASIAEDLDLSGCAIPQPLVFARCDFAGRISLRDAVTKSLNLSTSRALSIDAESVHSQGGVFLQDGFRATRGVSFTSATIEGEFSGRGGAFFAGGGRSAIACNGARITGNVALSGSFLGDGGVYFDNAKIGGEVNCAGGRFRNRTEDGTGVALACENAEIAQDAVLTDGHCSEGSVSFCGAKIGGALDGMRGALLNRTEDGTGRALHCAFTEIKQSVRLSDGFLSEGNVSFYGARIGGNVNLAGGRFDNSAPEKADGSPTWRQQAATAINLQGANIDGALWLGPIAQDAFAKAYIAGSVKLDGCHAHSIVDHPSSWPLKGIKASGKKIPAFIYLDSFTYDRFVGRGDYEAATRKRWLDRQPPRHLGLEFRPQPFEQLIKVYRDMGHEGHAREIAKFKERRRYRSLFIKLWDGWRDRPKMFGKGFASPLNTIAWPFVIAGRLIYRSAASLLLAAVWAIVGFGTAYWYGWGRLTLFLLALWMAGGLFYREVAIQGGFAPSNPTIFLNEKLQAKCGNNWTECKGAPPELPNFSPFTYSLDIMLPVLDLGQKHDWQPIDRPDKPVRMVFPGFALQDAYDLPILGIPDITIEEEPLAAGTVDAIVRAQTLLSWGALGLLIVMVSGLIKKD
jgi:hypothetical protein